MSISKSFMAASALSAVAFLSGCVSIKPWEGNPGLGEDRIDEPLLEPESISEEDLIISQAPKTIEGGFVNAFDNIFGGGNNYKVKRIEYTGSSGAPNTAYLSLPESSEPVPLIVVFPVLNANHSISEVLGKELARNGYAVLRLEGYTLDLDKIRTTKEAMDKFRFTILDARALMDFVTELPEIDEEKIGVAGISLGAILSATTMGVDEDVDAGAFILGGGGLAEILHDSQQSSIVAFRDALVNTGTIILTGGIFMFDDDVATLDDDQDKILADLRKQIMEEYGIKSREEFLETLRPYTIPLDPSTYAGSLDPCRTMILSARFDNVIPEERTRELWERLGRPEWATVASGHQTTFALYYYWSIGRAVKLFDRVLKEEACEAPNRPVPEGP